MLDPEDVILQQHADRQAAGPETAASYQDYIDDAAALKHLLRDRHIAVVLEPDKARMTDDIVDRWVHYLATKKPSTLAGCAGSLGHDLGRVLNDAHLHVRHSRHPTLSKEARGDDPGPAWESSTLSHIRAIRIRTLDGSDGAESLLRAGAANHADDFAARDMIVDLRGNGGGDDSYITTWFTPHVRASWTVPYQEQGMTLSSSGSSIVYWNYATWLRLNHHTLPAAFTAAHLQPRHDDRVLITTSNLTADETIHATTVSTGPADRAAWTGRMIVVVDGGTGSSAESAALLLKNAFGAVVVGNASYGVIDFGNSTPYYLPVSGMEVHVPAQANNWGAPVDFTGIQPDVPLPAATPLPYIAMNFNHIYGTGITARATNGDHQASR